MASRLIDFLTEESNHLIKFLTDPNTGVFETLDNVAKTLRRFIYNTVSDITSGKVLHESTQTKNLLRR